MSITTQGTQTLDDLRHVTDKAELVSGRIVYLMPSGDLPSSIAFEIAVTLRDYARRTGIGKAYNDGVGYTLAAPLQSGRESFSPDASYYTGPRNSDRMRFIEGIPVFAVEVRSENDYGPAAEREMADKRADYFEAGTLVVWDVDPIAEIITLYKSTSPTTGRAFFRTDTADAEPAVPGWRLKVDDIFTQA